MKAARLILVSLIGALTIFVFSDSVMAAMSSSNYRIDWDNVGFGGDDTSSSASYNLIDSVGGNAVGQTDGTTLTLRSGYREAGIEPVAEFTIYIQNKSSQVAALSISTTTISVTDATGYAIGDMIAIIQNEGASQVANIGKITNVAANDIIIDYYSSGVDPTIDGSNDFVYRLDGSSYSFGTLTNAIVSTGIVAWEVQADVDDGYGVYVYENDDLKSGSLTINDVSDGTVSSGSTEYGGRSSDSSLATSTFDSQDTAFTQNMSLVGSRSSNSFASRDFVTLKAAIMGSQAAGTYSHTLYFIYVGDY
ncbi:MAG: hypothetical protein ABH826_01290 [Patescibacteria group bacterium]|nr:hypothetical protein [Patescibacteria group bacterium]